MTRAQTTLDFGIGIGIFLITVAVVFTFVPSLLSPFTAGGSAQPIVVDRAATQLATDTLTSPDEPYVLNTSKAQNFFDENTDTQPNVGVLALDYRVNVTLTRSDGTCPSALADCRLGSTPSNSQSVSSARRVVSIAGERATLEVSIW